MGIHRRKGGARSSFDFSYDRSLGKVHDSTSQCLVRTVKKVIGSGGAACFVLLGSLALLAFMVRTHRLHVHGLRSSSAAMQKKYIKNKEEMDKLNKQLWQGLSELQEKIDKQKAEHKLALEKVTREKVELQQATANLNPQTAEHSHEIEEAAQKVGETKSALQQALDDATAKLEARKKEEADHQRKIDELNREKDEKEKEIQAVSEAKKKLEEAMNHVNGLKKSQP